MKIKPLYIYGIIVIVIIALLIIINSSEGESKDVIAGLENSMPQDDIHKGLSNEQGSSPSKGNVKEEFWGMLERLEKEVDANPSDTLKIREYAQFLSMAHQNEKALTQYEKILNIDPTRVDVLLSEGLIYYNSGNYDKAEEVTLKILEINKNQLDAKFNLGTIAVAKGDAERAREIWTEIVSEHPNTDAAKFAQEALESL